MKKSFFNLNYFISLSNKINGIKKSTIPASIVDMKM